MIAPIPGPACSAPSGLLWKSEHSSEEEPETSKSGDCHLRRPCGARASTGRLACCEVLGFLCSSFFPERHFLTGVPSSDSLRSILFCTSFRCPV